MRRNREFKYPPNLTVSDPSPTSNNSSSNEATNSNPPASTTTTTTTTPSATSIDNVLILEDDDIERQRKRMQEFNINLDTKRIAEEAQDEELLRLALELSISDTASERHRLNLNDLSESSSLRTTRTTTAPTTASSTATSTPTMQTPPIVPSPVTMQRHATAPPNISSSTNLSSQQQQQYHHPPQNEIRFEFPKPLANNSVTPNSTASVTSISANQPPLSATTTSTTTTSDRKQPQRRSILRQPSATTSSRSLEDFIFSGINERKDSNNRNDSFSVNGLLNSNHSIGVSVSSHRRMIPRSISTRSVGNDRSGDTMTTDDHLLQGNNNNDEYDFDDIEDDDDEDDDDDEMSFEDLDPDDSPELKRVQPSSPPQPQQATQKTQSVSRTSVSTIKTSVSQPSHTNRTDESAQRRKSAIPLNGADLSAASLRFQQFSSSMPDGLVLGMSTTTTVTEQRRYGQRRIRPGLVVSVNKPAPKVKPPGRPRTAASLQSPAIDDDVLRKIQASSSTLGSQTSSTRSNNNNNDSVRSNPPSTNSKAPAAKPGAVAIIGSVPAKAPEVRSAIVSHVLGGNGNNNSDIDPLRLSSHSVPSTQDATRGNRTVSNATTDTRPNVTTTTIADASPNRIPGLNVPSSDEMIQRPPYDEGKRQPRYGGSETRTTGSNMSIPTRSSPWNNAKISQPISTSNDAIQSEWPSLTAQRNVVRPSVRNKSRTGEIDLTEQELRDLERALRESATTEQQVPPPYGPKRSNDAYDLTGASQYLSTEELMTIQEALNENAQSAVPARLMNTDATISRVVVPRELEDEAIARALREADEEEERRSYELAIRMQQEEAKQYKSEVTGHARLQQHGNVQSMTRQEYEAQKYEQQYKAAITSSSQFENDDDNDDHVIDGFRMNSSAQHKWSRRDQTSVVGPNQEIRTKHDRTLHNEANAHRLGILSTDGNVAASVGNQAYNAFLQSMKNTNNKGVAAKGTGRAGSDSDATRGGAMDPVVRQHISRAINNEIIEKCNGVVKEGKEAVVYHADKGAESGGFDVAVKVYKKISEFRNRGYYVEGDPRYFGKTNFRNLSSKEQLELWTEKEFRNLTRASRAGVPVPIPLFYNDNILFMRFLGDDGWPAPQLRELELNHGSRRWNTLFSQILEAVKLLFQGGHLVHGDLSEYNILVAPSYFVVGPSSTVVKNNGEDLQIVLIDFGQAVDTRHPEATLLLERDLNRVLTFFTMQGIEVPTLDEAMVLVMG